MGMLRRPISGYLFVMLTILLIVLIVVLLLGGVGYRHYR